uniref:CCHC-type domain-containing protein n=1 Tax=Tanacetum cinerariifolium TaxID=118510 RepID=A0A699HRN6_TANCI|nr:hypothetical protein [Tanacetum cinerariifolium]
MTTLAEHITVAGAKNCPLIQEKSMYDSWASRIQLFIKGKKNGRMMLDLIDEGPLVYPTQGEYPINFINKVMEFPSAVASSGNKGISTTSRGNYAAGQPRIVNCQNCVREGHMTRQCTRPKWPRNYACFKEKFMLVEAQEVGQILDEKKLVFITDPGIKEALVAQQTIRLNSAFQTEDLDAYDSNYDDISLTKVVLMENLSSCDSDLLFKVPYFDTYPND